MPKRKVAALEKLDADFASLQYKIRRDPKSYIDDFQRQWDHYEAQKDIFLTDPTHASDEATENFHNLIDLIAHVADCYPEQTRTFPEDLKTVLSEHHATLAPELREKVVGSLVMLRRKELIDTTNVLTCLFPILISSPSKTFRGELFGKILSDMRNSNAKTINHPLNRTIQTVLYNLVTGDRSSPRAIWAIKLTRELWKRQIWTDAKPVDVMKEACLADNEKVVVGAVRFFLGGDKEREELEDESSDEEIDLSKVRHHIAINKKSKKSKKAYDKAVSKVHRAERQKNKPHPLNFSALHLLHDPQEFAEQLFQKHLRNTKTKLSQDTKILVLQLVTRLVGLHKLTIVALYSWFIKFLTPRQSNVTSFLACLAQGTHNLVPPDVLEPLLQKIANEFVSEAAANEVASAGINSIREICARQPLAMTDTLLQDLVQYRKSKDKGVMMAAKGLLSLYREANPELLKKKDRGKDATMGLSAGTLSSAKFGEEATGEIEGLDLLEKWKEDERKRKRVEKGLPEDADSDEENEEESDGWEVGSDDSSDSGGWINVSDSEDEEPPPKKAKNDDDEEANKENEAEIKRISDLATTTILTPADLAKLQELRAAASINKAMGASNRSRKQDTNTSRHQDDELTAENIEAPARLRKLTKEEKVALAKEGKPAREEHKSTTAINKSKKEAAGKSTTNKEKARKKNFFMTLGKARINRLLDNPPSLHANDYFDVLFRPQHNTEDPLSKGQFQDAGRSDEHKGEALSDTWARTNEEAEDEKSFVETIAACGLTQDEVVKFLRGLQPMIETKHSIMTGSFVNPPELKADVVPFDHQKSATIHALNGVNSSFRGSILGDPPGSGKTLAALMTACEVARQSPGPVVFVVPQSLARQWMAEIKTMIDTEIMPAVCLSEFPLDEELDITKHKLVVTTYTMIADEFAQLDNEALNESSPNQAPTHGGHAGPNASLMSYVLGAANGPSGSKVGPLLVLDEAHTIKDPRTVRSSAAMKLRESFTSCLILTGNLLSDSWIDCLGPLRMLEGHPFIDRARMYLAFTSYEAFDVTSDLADLHPESGSLTRFQQLLDAVMLVRPIATIKNQSHPHPTKTWKKAFKSVIKLGTTLEQDRIANKLFQRFTEAAETKHVAGQAINDEDSKWWLLHQSQLATYNLELLKVADIDMPSYVTDERRQALTQWQASLIPEMKWRGPRVDAVLAIIDQHVSRSRPPGAKHAFVIMDESVALLHLLEVAIGQLGWKCWRCDETMTGFERSVNLEMYKDRAGTKILLMSKAIGLQGLSMPYANVLIQCSPWEQAAEEQQAFGRIKRIGQQQDCYWYQFTGALTDSD